MADAFEQAFSDLAYSFLQEKAIKLVDHLVGFEVVEKDDSGSRGLGMFAFKVGDEYFYAPVFFLNSEIKPLDILYLKNSDLFIPLDEDWVNYLLKKDPLILGEAADQKMQRFDEPQLSMFSHPPITGKHVTAALREVLGKKTYKTLEYLHQAPNHIKTAFLKKCRYDKDYVQEAVRAFGFENIKKATRLHAEKRAADDTKSVEVVTIDDSPKAINNLSPEDRRKVYRERVVVRDSRPADQTTKLYNKQYQDKLQNPQKSGVYSVLDEDGSLVEALIVLTPQDQTVNGSKKAVVVEIESRKFVTALPSEIWVKDNFVIDDMDGLFKTLKAVDRKSGKIDKQYMFLGSARDGEVKGSVPFSIDRLVKDTDGILNYTVSPKDGWEEPFGNNYPSCNRGEVSPRNTYFDQSKHMRSELSNEGVSWKVCLSPLEKISDGHLHLVSGELVVPTDYRLIPLEDARVDVFSDAPVPVDGAPDSTRREFKLGRPGAVAQHLMDLNIGKLRVRTDGSEYFVSYNDMTEKPMSKESAVRVLVLKYGLTGNDSDGLLKAADTVPNKDVLVLAKLAQMPSFSIPDPTIGADTGYVPKGLQFFSEQLQGGGQTYPQAPMIGEGENMYTPPDEAPPELDMQAAMSAAGGGQQTVFDHASLGALVRSTDIGEAINRYLPDMEKALDRVGRLLFLFWWNYDQFSELFGITRMSEIEDQLRDVFSSFGDLILELKKKERARLVG